MVRNVSKPSYFGSGHVLNSKLVQKQSLVKIYVFLYELNPNND